MKTDRETRASANQHDQPLRIPAAEPLPQLAAFHAHQQALEDAVSQPDVGSEHYRHGRVEAETRRISEEVTRQAQAQRRVTQVVQAQQDATFPQQRTDAAPEPNAAQTEQVAPAPSALAAPPTPSAYLTEALLAMPKSLHRILVPLDGSENGERVLPYAAAFAALLHARLIVGHVSPAQAPNPLAQALHVPGSTRLAAQEAFAPQALSYLHQVRERLTTHSAQVETLHITAPSVVEGLVELENSTSADLALLALRPHMTGERLSLGRVVDHLTHLGPTPLLVIPLEAETRMMPLTVWHILIPLDGSPLAEEALKPLLSMLAQTLHQAAAPLAVTLLSVAENRTVLPQTQRYLDTVSAALRATPYCANLHMYAKAEIGSAPGAIVGFIEYGAGGDHACAEPVDMLIMATHGRSGMSHWLYGSVAEYVLPRVHIPVLLVHPRSAAPSPADLEG